MAQWLALLLHSDVSHRFDSRPVTLLFVCSPCVCVVSLWVLQLALTVQKHACEQSDPCDPELRNKWVQKIKVLLSDK